MPPVARTEPLPQFVAPMLLQTCRKAVPDDGSWAIEVKFDGIRAQVRVDGRRGWSLRSRPGRNCTAEFPELALLAEALGRHRVVLDGELVHFAEHGLPDFGALRRRLTSRGPRAALEASVRAPATLVVFDVLHLDGHAVRALPYRQRRELLGEMLPEGSGWRLAPSWTEDHHDVIEVTRQHGLEGVVYKQLNSSYRPGKRSSAWRKLKHRRHETLAVTAWTPGDRQPDTYYLARREEDGEPSFAGAVQLGLDRRQREQLRLLMDQHQLPTPRRHRVRPVRPGVSLVVSGHGPAGSPLRDAVIREVLLDHPR
jgi:bifunctional non-homologous end joining protein LigD